MAGKRKNRPSGKSPRFEEERNEDVTNECWNGKRIKHKFDIITWDCGFFCYQCKCGIFGKRVINN